MPGLNPLSVPIQASLQGLTSAQVHQLNQLLENHSAVFLQDDPDYGHTTTLGSQIVCTRPGCTGGVERELQPLGLACRSRDKEVLVCTFLL